MQARLVLVALVTLGFPAIAAAQVDDSGAPLAIAPTDGQLQEDELIEEDRVLSARLLEASGRDPSILAFRTELHALDQRLYRRQRPGDTMGAGLALIVPGGLGVVGGLVLVLVGALSSAAHAGACAIGTLLGSSGCAPANNDAFFVAGGVALGVGLLALFAGIAVAVSGRSDRRAFDRRDELRDQLRTWMSATVTPSGDGAVVVVGGSF